MIQTKHDSQNPRMYYRAKELIRVCHSFQALLRPFYTTLLSQKAKEIENARKIHDPVKEKGNIGPV